MTREPLSNVDAAWLRMEDPTNLMMVTGLMLFEERLEMDRLRRVLRDRLVTFPRFRQRVRSARLGLGAPAWEDDAKFDIDSHLHRIALPSPGDKRALENLVSDLLSTPLDYSKPLWQIHLIEGYGDGCALLSRIHHAIADGIALVGLMLSLTDTEPGGDRDQRPARPARRAARLLPPMFDLPLAVAEQGLQMVQDPSRALALAKFAAGGAFELARLTIAAPDPKTALRGELGVAKRAAWSRNIPLDAIKRAGRAAGGTVNDVLVSAATGALRRYLIGRGERLEGVEIRAAIPVNLRPLDRALDLGNRFGLVYLSMPLGIADPFERFGEVRRRMNELKDSPQALVAYGVLSAIGTVPSQVQPLAVQFFGSKASVVMTNVPGPREPLFLAGRRISSVMFWVPQSGHLGIGISILSYAGSVMVGVNTDAGLIPDPEAVVSAFHDEIDQLVAGRPEAMTTPRRPATKRRIEPAVPAARRRPPARRRPSPPARSS